MGLRAKLRRLEEATEGILGSFELEDGSVHQYYAREAIREGLSNLYERWGAELEGRPDPGACLFVENLRRAKAGELERVIEEEGSLVQLFVKEDRRLTTRKEQR